MSTQRNRSLPQTVLVLLPGLLVAISMVAPVGLWFGRLMAAAFLLPAVAAVAIAVRSRTVAAFPVWGLLPLGALLFAGPQWVATRLLPGQDAAVFYATAALAAGLAILAWWRARVSPGSRRPLSRPMRFQLIVAVLLLVRLFWGGFDGGGLSPGWILIALPAAAGLLLAPAHGVRAVLLLLPAGYFVMAFDVEWAIYFSRGSAWAPGLSLAAAILFFIVLPLWLVRAASPASRALGLVVPPVVYWALLAGALAAGSTIEGGQIVRVAWPAIVLIFIVVCFGGLYDWLGPEGEQLPAPALNPEQGM